VSFCEVRNGFLNSIPMNVSYKGLLYFAWSLLRRENVCNLMSVFFPGFCEEEVNIVTDLIRGHAVA
jgi:hypothetical protein